MKYKLLAIPLLIFVGCSTPYREAPRPTNFKKTDQHKLQALSHWQIVANDYSKYLLSKIDKTKTYKIIYTSNTKFSKDFRYFLESDLVNKNVKITIDDENYDSIIEINENLVKFRPNRSEFDDIQGVLPLGAGVAVLLYKLADLSTGAAVATGIMSAEMFIAYQSKYNKTPQYELMLNTRIYDRDKILKASLSRAYYIADLDNRLYQKTTKTIYVEGN